MIGNLLKFETTMSNFERVNQEFMRVKVNVCYSGENRNGSDFDDDTIVEMAKTIYGVPVVGEVSEEDQTFKGHGGKLEISDDGFKVVDTTIPYGFVDPTTEVFYEDILEKDGITLNRYLSCYAYLWRGKFPILDKIFEKHVGQSMEIAVEDGEYQENGIYKIKKARFQALCLLGVEPCFESAKATIGYSLEEKDGLYKEMMEKFKSYTLDSFTLGGEEVEKETIIEQDVVVENEFDNNEVATEEVVIENVVEDTVEVEDVVEETIEEDNVEVVEEVAEVDNVEVETNEVEETVEQPQENYEEKYEALVIEYGKLQATHSELQAQYDNLVLEHGELLQFKQDTLAGQRKIEEEELFAKFESLIGFDGYEELKANANQFSIEDLETKLFALLGKKNFSFNVKQKKNSTVKLKVESVNNVSNVPYYGGILDKYIKN